MESNVVDELRIVEDNQNIFDINGKYIIPLYQRAFAWKDKHLEQLVDDINDIPDNEKYYIGSLIVSCDGNVFEVIDGQQRLTSLYLLLSCLGLKLKNTLSFACRVKSDYTLNKIHDILNDNRNNYEEDKIEQSIYEGIKFLSNKIKKEQINLSDLLNKLERVILYRIEVPKNTDLNRYFEIMNTRGEQLEQHDILKANLMSYLKGDNEKIVFAKIWEACSDMSGYVQMHFDTKFRIGLFGKDWNELPSADFNDVIDVSTNLTDSNNDFLIKEIIHDNNISYEDEILDEDNNRIRFKSVIEFPFFLLHVLRVFVYINSIYSKNNTELLNELLDDKKLISNFNDVINNGLWHGNRNIGKEKFSKCFIAFLLRCRYLFDKYIIKTEFANDISVGEWSLKELCVSGQGNNKKPYFRNTSFVPKWGKNNIDKNKTNIMLQSALRVSYTSPKVMHWITDLLIWLSENNCLNIEDNNIVNFRDKIENIAKEAVRKDFFSECSDEIYAMGVNTPHIVFNYLDFLIWESDSTKYDDFDFEFRNSVEHWYPQHPSEGDPWTDSVDQFGNLCIIQRNINSRFSNLNPEAKKIQNSDTIKKGSLKLRIMSELTQGKGNKSAISRWKDDVCQQHGEEMIKMLKNACFEED